MHHHAHPAEHISERTNLAQLLSILLSTLLHAPLSALPGLSSVDRTSECTTLCLLSTRSGTPLSTLPGRNTERTPTRPLIDCNQVTARIAHPPMCQQKRSMYSTLCHHLAAMRAPPPQNHLKTTFPQEMVKSPVNCKKTPRPPSLRPTANLQSHLSQVTNLLLLKTKDSIQVFCTDQLSNHLLLTQW